MDYRELISESWSFTQKNKKMIWWFGFLPSVFTTTGLIIMIVYQYFAFKSSELFSNGDQHYFSDIFNIIREFFQNDLALTMPVVITLIIVGIIYFLFPTMAKAAAIQMIARKKNGQKIGVGGGFKYGLMSFLALFEYHMLIKAFGFFSILVEMSVVLRNLGPGLFQLLLPVFLLIIVIGFILGILFTYTSFYIVIDDEGVFDSIKKSSRLVITHLKHTFLMTILMLIIGIRVIIQAIMVFLIPALIMMIAGYIATVTLATTGLIVGGIVGFISLLIAAYLTGIVEIFSFTVWTFTFLKLSSEKELSAREAFVDDIGEHPLQHVSHKNL